MRIDLFDGRVLRGIATKAKEAKKQLQQISKKYNTQVQNHLEVIAESAVGDFYSDYDPWMYVRNEDLYNAYKIAVNDDKWEILLGPEFMKSKHNQDNKYVYWLTMVAGMHGGFPHAGDFYTRTWPYFYTWYDTAARGPEDTEGRIIDESNEYLDDMIAKRDNELDSKINPILDEIEARIARL